MVTTDLVLLASASLSARTHAMVEGQLRRMGRQVLVYQTDRVLDGRDAFDLTVTPGAAVRMRYNGTEIDPRAIAAAWYWKVANFQVADADREVARQLSVSNELRYWHHSLFDLLPEGAWLNSPRATERAESKFRQLLSACAVGFSVPRTVVSNSWDTVTAQCAGASGSSDMIVKQLGGVIADDHRLRATYTAVLDPQAVRELRDVTAPFPGLFQPYIAKSREWRVTVVGDEVFPVAVHTDQRAKDDWRRLQRTSAVRFVPAELPAHEVDRCRAYLRAHGLSYGAFDFIETPDGELVFLECNPAGQYGWLEETLGLPISAAIAAQLVRIADGRGG